MSEELVDEAFESVSENLDSAHQKAVSELKEKVEKAKSAALKKIS